MAEQVLQKVMGRVSPEISASMAKMDDHSTSLEGGKEASKLLMPLGKEWEGRTAGGPGSRVVDGDPYEAEVREGVSEFDTVC